MLAGRHPGGRAAVERGVTSVEYAMVLALMVVVALVGLGVVAESGVQALRLQARCAVVAVGPSCVPADTAGLPNGGAG